MRSGATWLASASRREDVKESHQPLECAWTKAGVADVVPAPMREDANENVQPLECAWTNVETNAKSLVPAPRLELGTP